MAPLEKRPVSDSCSEVTARARFWPKYKRVADEYDAGFLKKHSSDLDTALIFAGLFSAVNTTFIVGMQPDLAPDPNDRTHELLGLLIRSSNGTSIPIEALQLQKWAGPSATVIWVQSLLYASLACSLLAALFAVLGKQWLGHYAWTDLRDGLERRCTDRQRKCDGIEAWGFRPAMDFLPLVLLASLLLFSAGIAMFLWERQIIVALVIIIALLLGVLLYGVTAILSTLYDHCPYRTPVPGLLVVSLRMIGKPFGVTGMQSLYRKFQTWYAAWTARHCHRMDILRDILSRFGQGGTRGGRIISRVACTISMFVIYSMLQLHDIVFALYSRRLQVLALCQRCSPSLLLKAVKRQVHSMTQLFTLTITSFIDVAPEADLLALTWILEHCEDPSVVGSVFHAPSEIPQSAWVNRDKTVVCEQLLSAFKDRLEQVGVSSAAEREAVALGKGVIHLVLNYSREVKPHVFDMKWSRDVSEYRPELRFICTFLSGIEPSPVPGPARRISFDSIPTPAVDWFAPYMSILCGDEFLPSAEACDAVFDLALEALEFPSRYSEQAVHQYLSVCAVLLGHPVKDALPLMGNPSILSEILLYYLPLLLDLVSDVIRTNDNLERLQSAARLLRILEHIAWDPQSELLPLLIQDETLARRSLSCCRTLRFRATNLLRSRPLVPITESSMLDNTSDDVCSLIQVICQSSLRFSIAIANVGIVAVREASDVNRSVYIPPLAILWSGQEPPVWTIDDIPWLIDFIQPRISWEKHRQGVDDAFLGLCVALHLITNADSSHISCIHRNPLLSTDSEPIVIALGLLHTLPKTATPLIDNLIGKETFAHILTSEVNKLTRSHASDMLVVYLDIIISHSLPASTIEWVLSPGNHCSRMSFKNKHKAHKARKVCYGLAGSQLWEFIVRIAAENSWLPSDPSTQSLLLYNGWTLFQRECLVDLTQLAFITRYTRDLMLSDDWVYPAYFGCEVHAIPSAQTVPYRCHGVISGATLPRSTNSEGWNMQGHKHSLDHDSYSKSRKFELGILPRMQDRRCPMVWKQRCK
ncbi:hypothetical protein HGRIS_010235 [Hohenbuehelia grisea]|uniref:DUF6535 domain-containing protein n=1 Tax=Hohenbuehelia grisea TaxID=104357 RepID=A0ABR3J3N4_9AGAR